LQTISASTTFPSAIHDKGDVTCKNEQRMFNKWIDPEIGHLPFEKIAPFNIEKIKKSMLDAGRAPRTVQYVLAIVRQTWNHAIANNHVDRKFPKITLKKFDNKRTKYLTTEQVDLLLEKLQKANSQLHDMASAQPPYRCPGRGVVFIDLGECQFQ
jgi:site-specific recombinase XerD